MYYLPELGQILPRYLWYASMKMLPTYLCNERGLLPYAEANLPRYYLSLPVMPTYNSTLVASVENRLQHHITRTVLDC